MLKKHLLHLKKNARIIATGQEAFQAFQNLGKALRSGVHTEIEHWSNLLDVISKRQWAQVNKGTPWKRVI